MPEAMGHIGQLFGGATSAFKTLKEGANAIREAKNLELYERMLAVYGDVMELAEKNRELVEENHALKQQLKAYQQEQEIAGELQHHDNAYWRTKDGERDGPFCMRCWDANKKLIREKAGATPGTHYRPECAMRRR